MIAALVIGATIYNALLAIINAHITPLGFSAVVATEMLILVSALLIILQNGLFEKDVPALGLLIFALVIAAYMSVVNAAPIIDYFRAMLIVFCFATLGTWAGVRTVKFVFIWTTAIVFFVLLLEIFSVEKYGDLFFPGLYFENTRGIERASYFDTKLFQNALGFQGRFSFGIINHRSSSVFLEQVSLANYSGVLMIALITLWERFTKFQRTFCIATIVLILVTNDSRTMLIFAFICMVGYHVFPHLPKAIALLYLPAILGLGFVVYALKPDAEGDNIAGRVVLTMEKFAEMDLMTLLGFAAETASSFADSGYIYVIVIGTVFNLVLWWLFVCLYPAGRTAEQRRFVHGFAIFVFMNLLIGGTAVFSIKIAALFWLLAGSLKMVDMQSPAPSRMPEEFKTKFGNT